MPEIVISPGTVSASWLVAGHYFSLLIGLRPLNFGFLVVDERTEHWKWTSIAYYKRLSIYPPRRD